MEKTILKAATKIATTLVLACGVMASAHAVPVTINMTADNIVNNGGLCFDASCVTGAGWSALSGSLPNMSNWTQSDSLTIDLDAGTHYFAWQITNSGPASSSNPAALLAEILWDGNANYSSAGWEIYNQADGSFIANATEYGLNGAPNIWTTNNGGAVAGISTSANWIYTANNFASADASAWIRTSITIASAPEPGVLGLLGIGLLGLAYSRRKYNA